MVEPNEESLSSLCRNLAFSTIWWTVLYFALVKTKIWGQQSAEFYCRIVTVVHAVTVVTLSVGCYWQGPDPYKSPGERNTLLQDITLEISLGYFLYDLGWSLYHQTEPAIMILHHVVSVISIGTVLFTRTSGGEAVAGILSLEMTNPLLQMRWFLRTAGYNNTLAHTIVELVFVAMFLVMRLGLGSAITYCVVTSPKPRRDVKFCTLSLYLISLAFIFYIFQFIRRKYIGKKSND